MFIEIKDNILYQYADWKFNDNAVELNIDYSTFNRDEYEVQDGQLVDISETSEYKAKVLEKENAIKKADLQAQIDAIDKKRVRALAEPSTKDDATGQTYLEYYTEQIQDLRAQIAAL